MPSDMKFDPSIPAHVSDNQVMRIAVNSDVRLKVVASRIEANEIVCYVLLKVFDFITVVCWFNCRRFPRSYDLELPTSLFF